MTTTPTFSFTRVPSEKISIQIEAFGLVPADNEVVLIGRRALTGGSAVDGVPVQIQNIGDDIPALQTEVDGLFGVGAEIGDMVVAAVEAVLFSDLDPRLFPPIKAIPLANAETNVTTTLANNITLPMPFAALGFPTTDATNRTAFRDHLIAISASDRGTNGQFGSFGFMHSDASLATLTPIAEGVARQEMVFPSLIDTAVTKANKSANVAAALCALSAANIIPFNPLNQIKIGKLVAPVDASDHHTGGDAGTVSVGLTAGLVPLEVTPGGDIVISRTVTSARRVVGIPDSSYFDMQDWQALYLMRKNAFNLTQQPQFKRTKATNQKAEALRSGIIEQAKALEDLDVLQFVDQLVDRFTFKRDPTNRHAFIFTVPLNVVPGFHNKGIGLIGTTEFDLVTV